MFYGDSITDQRRYTSLVETYVLTRFPQLDVHFVHSGWGGDRVTGGGGGPIDVRLYRDVLSYNPTAAVTAELFTSDDERVSTRGGPTRGAPPGWVCTGRAVRPSGVSAVR